jgi:hypothetical protein
LRIAGWIGIGFLVAALCLQIVLWQGADEQVLVPRILKNGQQQRFVVSDDVYHRVSRTRLVEWLPESEARRKGMLTDQRCDGCALVRYEIVSRGLWRRDIRVSSWSGVDAAAGWRETFVFVLGRWVHLRTVSEWVA